ncbi:MAG: hypothetical protein NXY57DRAFT_702618 [Lentinula lateritia]|nr:MAG: hypothetical protein NXY57DRAFT_702618 [Lentinula lateritia]
MPIMEHSASHFLLIGCILILSRAFKSSHIHSMNTVGVCGLPLGPDEKPRNETKSHRKLLLIVGKPLYLPIRAFPKMHKFDNILCPRTLTTTE